MNFTVFRLTVREFVGQRRSLMMLLLAAIPIGLAVIFRVSDPTDQQDWTANFLMDGTIVTLVLPLACLILGTAALGGEIENSTILYLLAKPISRRDIVGAKFAAAALVVVVVLIPATVASGLIALQGVSEQGTVAGFTLAVALGAVTYIAVFLLVSLITSRALLVGLGYVFIWETLVTELFPATSYLSVRQYCLGIADAVSSVSAQDFEAELGGEALILAAVVTIGALVLATQRLAALEVSDAE